MKTFDSVASLKLAKIPTTGVGERVARYYYEKGDAGYAEGVVKTASQATADGDIIDGYYNVTLANGNVWIGDRGATFNVLKAGVKVDGTDTTAEINNLQNFEGEMFFPSEFTYIYSGNYELDVSKQSFRSSGAKFDCTGVTDFAFRIFSTEGYTDRPLKNNTKVAMYGFGIEGLNVAGNFCFFIGRTGAEYAESNDIVVERCGVIGFEKQVVFGDNGWRTHFKDCGFERGGYPIFFDQPSNAGEVIEFSHCWIVDWSDGIYLNAGSFNFNGCSLFGGASSEIQFLNTSKAVFDGCNLESQPSSGFFMLNLQDVSRVTFNGGQLLLNLGVDFESPLIRVTGGASLTLLGVSLPLYGSGIKYETNAASGKQIRSIVEGWTSNVRAYGCDTIAGTLADYTTQAVLGGTNMLGNADFELGNVNEWVQSPYGTGVTTFTADAGQARNGSYGLLINAPADSGGEFYQDFDVSTEAGRNYCFGLWVKAVSGTGAIAFPKIQFKAYDGAVIANTTIATVDATDTTYKWYAVNGYIPSGAKTARVLLEAQQQAGGVQIAYDSIIFQLI